MILFKHSLPVVITGILSRLWSNFHVSLFLCFFLFFNVNVFGQFKDSYTVLDSILFVAYQSEQDSVWYKTIYESNEYGLNSDATEFHFNDDSVKWVPEIRKAYSFNIFGLCDTILEIRRDKESGVWNDYSRIIDGYDEMGRDTVHSTYRWYEAYDWMGEHKVYKKYDSYGNLIYEETMGWDMMQNIWIGQNLVTWEKDQNGLELGRTDYMVGVGDPYWFAHTWTEHKYDERGLDTLTTIHGWDGINEEWKAYDKSVRTYNANGKEMEHLMYYQDPENGSWVLQAKYAYTYEAGNDTICEVYDLLRDGEWIPFWRKYHVYIDGLETYFEGSIWNADSGKYESTYKEIRVFNEFGSLTFYEVYNYNLDSSLWIGGNPKIENRYNSEGELLEHAISYWVESVSDWKLFYKDYYGYSEVNDLPAPQISVLTDTVSKYTPIGFISSQDARVYLVPDKTLPDADLDQVSLGNVDVFAMVSGSIETSSLADSGLYLMYAINGDGLISLATRVWITLPQTAVPMMEEVNIRIYPTLVDHSFTVESEQAFEIIELYDLYGRLVKVIKGETRTVHINISDLNPGIYCVIPDRRTDLSVRITKM
jgi:hypothetical protein